MRFGAFQETRALRPPQRVLLKKLDLRRPLTTVTAGQSPSNQDLRVDNPGSMIRGWIACSVRQKRAFLRERGFANAHLAAYRGVDRRGTHEQCGPGGWPGPHFIWAGGRGATLLCSMT